MASINIARYGKDKVRVCKIQRDEETGVHTVTEMIICVLLEGAIASSYVSSSFNLYDLMSNRYTRADNSVIVATDSMKNTIFIKAKENPVNPPELFASVLGNHFIITYPHITVAKISIITYRWARMGFDGQPHPHAFYGDGTETRMTEANVQRGRFEISSSIIGLSLFKSTGSQFHGFIRDQFTTLPEVWDRIFSTDINCTWTWKLYESIDAVKSISPQFDRTWIDIRNITMRIFAEDESLSVQSTMFKMCSQILQTFSDVSDVEYKLPNKHYNMIGKCFQ